MIGAGAIASAAIAAIPRPKGGVSHQRFIASVPLRISVCDEQVMASRSIAWLATVTVGDVDISARLSGRMSIKAAEDSARVATLEVTPLTPDELTRYDCAPITIDYTITSATGSATYRRFTGTVEQIEFDDAARLATITARDGYQERPKACTTAAEVEALFNGLAVPCNAVLEWSDTDPDPASYYAGLLDTLPGAVAIDGSGAWRVIPWTIGAPAYSYTAGQIFDETIGVKSSPKKDFPASVYATMTLRYSRLHAVELPLSWDGLNYYRLALDGCTWPARSAVTSALSGLSGWYVKGTVAFTMLEPGAYPVLHAGTTTQYLISYATAAAACNGFSATLYTRWYQEVDKAFSITIPLGGAGDRDESISDSVASDWNAGGWESASSSSSATNIYSANPPASTVIKTGYEGLPTPFPPANGALDWCPDITPDEAVNHTAHKALRTAAQGLRKRQVAFATPLDPRWDIGAVLGAAAGSTTAIGQVVEFEDALDHDSGDVSTTWTLAVPAGNGATTAITVTVPALSNDAAHAYPAPTLTNWVGASKETAADPDEDTVTGWLTNVNTTSDYYLSTAPRYEEQMRVVMPEITHTDRDPVTEEAVVDIVYSIASGTLKIDWS